METVQEPCSATELFGRNTKRHYATGTTGSWFNKFSFVVGLLLHDCIIEAMIDFMWHRSPMLVYSTVKLGNALIYDDEKKTSKTVGTLKHLLCELSCKDLNIWVVPMLIIFLVNPHCYCQGQQSACTRFVFPSAVCFEWNTDNTLRKSDQYPLSQV